MIEAELSGFQRYRREGLTLTTGATVPLDMKLSLGELIDSVTVRGELGIGQVDGGHTLGAPDFGIVSNAAGGRTIQLGLRAVF